MGTWRPQSYHGAAPTAAGLQRNAFTLQFDTANLQGYIDDHATGVWPEMQQALVDCNWQNYSLFYRPDGFAVGFFECDVGFDEACARMDAKEINAKWQAVMAKYTVADESPIEASGELQHYFYLGEDTTGGTAQASADVVWVPQTFHGATPTAAGRRRNAFTLQFDTANLQGYLDDHATGVWPEMQQALVDCNWQNYSLFYRPDGFAVGFFECDVGFDEACARMDAKEINAKWQAVMAKYTVADESPIEASGELQHYFYLGTDKP